MCSFISQCISGPHHSSPRLTRYYATTMSYISMGKMISFSCSFPGLQQQPVLACATAFLNSTNSCCKASVINSWRTPIFIRSASLLHLTQKSFLNFLWVDSSLISSLLRNLYWFLFSCAFSSSNPFINLAINLSQQALYSPGSSIYLSLIFKKLFTNYNHSAPVDNSPRSCWDVGSFWNYFILA